MAVEGSLTAGEIAFNAISTICRTPNSTSCCNVLVGPKSNAASISAVPSGGRRFPFPPLRRGIPPGRELPAPPQNADADVVVLRHRDQASRIDEADVAGTIAQEGRLARVGSQRFRDWKSVG